MSVSAVSQNGILIRLTEERWEHIINGHSELIGYQSDYFTRRLRSLAKRKQLCP